jgi:hypothetical protein
MKPRARRDGLIVQQVDDETVVYDEERDRVHCLNRVAAAVWERCDGRLDLAGIRSRVARDLDAPLEADAVRLALEKLAKAKLLATPAPVATTAGRRAALRRLGTAALVPIVSTIVAPDARAANTQAQSGECCDTAGDCVSGRCVSSNSSNCGIRCPPGRKCCG